MSQDKRKSENYNNLGGINTKASQYLTGPTEFLDLHNYDFQTPGSLSKRWGSSQYIGPTFGASFPIQGLFEFEQLSGFSQIVFSHTGGLWAGATTGLHQGLSFAVIGATVTLSIYGTVAYAYNASGVNWVPFGAGPSSGGLVFPNKAFASTMTINAELLGQNRFDSVNFVNNMFQASSSYFYKYNGTATTKISLPGGTCTFPDGADVYDGYSLGQYLPYGYEYSFAVSYVNNRGYEGPLYPVLGPLKLNYDFAGAVFNGASLSAGFSVAGSSHFGSSFVAARLIVNTPLSYGISSINVWIYRTAGTTTWFTANDFYNMGSSLWSLNFSLLDNFPASGSTTTTIIAGCTTGSANTFLSGQLAPITNYVQLGMRSPSSQGTSLLIVDAISPQFIEIYSNRLFLSGLTTAQSTVYYSDVGEPEGYEADWNFEVRTNDGDSVTALKAYNSRLYIFKNNSFSELSGESPDTFVVREVSDQYGCLSNRATVVYNNIMLFLDKKGICEFNGANTQVISNKVQSYFDRLNISAAQNNATMIHDKQRNQILIGMPIDSSTTNNITIVYDYLVGAWTTYDGFSPAVFAMIKGRLGIKTAMFGDYSGRIMYFGASFMSDNGTGFTLVAKTRFLSDLGNSIQKQFRRLFLDSTVGATSPMMVRFFQDHGSSIVYSATMSQLAFQSRIDFGINAKSLALQFENVDTSNPLLLNGFTIEHRIQRMV